MPSEYLNIVNNIICMTSFFKLNSSSSLNNDSVETTFGYDAVVATSRYGTVVASSGYLVKVL